LQGIAFIQCLKRYAEFEYLRFRDKYQPTIYERPNVKSELKLNNYNLKGKNMKGEILKRAKHIVLNIVKYTIKIAWEIIIIDELALEIIWEALNLFGLYITLRIVKHMLPIAEYLPLEVKTSSIKLIEERIGQEMKLIGNLFDIGGFSLWQIRRLHNTLQVEINVLKSLIMDYENDVLLYDNFINEPDCTSVHLKAPHVTEALTSSYCC